MCVNISCKFIGFSIIMVVIVVVLSLVFLIVID